MATVVGSLTSPIGKLKNCDTWGEYELPDRSEFASLCNGGTFDGYRWQPCPSRLECRQTTYRASGQQNLQVLGSTRDLRSRPKPIQDEPFHHIPEPPEIMIPEGTEKYLRTPRLEPKTYYRPSPTFLPTDGEHLAVRVLKNITQGIIHSVFHQGKEIAEHTDFFPHDIKDEDMK